MLLPCLPRQVQPQAGGPCVAAGGMLDTIKVPRNFQMIQNKLPPAQYEGDDMPVPISRYAYLCRCPSAAMPMPVPISRYAYARQQVCLSMPVPISSYAYADAYADARKQVCLCP